MTSAARVDDEAACGWHAAWEWAAGSVQGREHWLARRNRQDATCVLATPRAIVVVVSDGCGSAAHSEIGARLLATTVARTLAREFARRREVAAALRIQHALDEALAILARLAAIGDGLAAAFVADHLLATMLAAIITPSRATVVRVGDGIVGVNGAIASHRAPGNAPPYLAYRLLPDDAHRFTRESLAPVVEWDGDARELDSLVLATDGADELPGAREGGHETLRAWLADDASFQKPHALERRLACLARDEQRIDWEAQVVHRRPGVLRDDTSVALLRRRAREEA